jgi:hypothetical protein
MSLTLELPRTTTDGTGLPEWLQLLEGKREWAPLPLQPFALETFWTDFPRPLVVGGLVALDAQLRETERWEVPGVCCNPGDTLRVTIDITIRGK